MKTFSLLCILLGIVSAVLLPRKQLAGPPSEFEQHRLPKPEEAALTEHGAFININLEESGVDGTKGFSTPLPVDSSELFAFAIFSPVRDHLDWTLLDPTGQSVEMKGTASFFPVGDTELPCLVFVFSNPKVGVWTLSAKSKEGEDIPTSDLTNDGAIMTFNQSPLKAWTHLLTYHLTTQDRVGLVSRITTEEADVLGGVAPQAMSDVIFQAYMDVVMPDGTEVTVKMHDDGLNGDGAANDGVYGGSIGAKEVGTYTATATLKGRTSDGVEFIRSTEHVIPVTPNEIDLAGTAFATLQDENHYMVHLAVETPELPENALFRAYTEVYGTGANGEEVPVCWLSSMVNPHVVSGVKVVSLTLDVSWLAKAGAKVPLTLKHSYIQDAYVHVPLTYVDVAVHVSLPNHIIQRVQALPYMPNLLISQEMKVGVPPASFSYNRSLTASDDTLVLIHGYCSDGNPFASQKQHFTDASFFVKSKANLSNQKFAELVAEFVDTQGIDAFSVIGHSQGGTIGLHLLNYYFTAMDKTAATGRKIQSVGTPYLGCSGAGSSANLVKIFGYGCGANTDLTVDGARLWLAGITADSRSHVYYYTTTYSKGSWFGDYCNLAVNLVLEWPNDGTAEEKYCQLPKGNNMGNKEKWCHTTDMGYPAQYLDATRNKEMNAFASR